jgi:diaminopimelate epimerase
MIVQKYNANGNDFIITHQFKKANFTKFVQKICHRQKGIGADGFIVLIPNNKYDFEWLFYNSDGSEAEMCGNGSRAVAHYALNNGLANSSMRFLTKAGDIGCTVNDNIVTTELTIPIILNREIIEFNEKWFFVNTGVPHLVSIRNSIENFSIEEARQLRKKYNSNINIAKIENGNLFVRTYERGVENETLACGTGMAASFFTAFEYGLVSKKINVFPKSKEKLKLAKRKNKLFYTGEVQKLFTTEFQ